MTRLLILGGGGILGSEVIRLAEFVGIDYLAPSSKDLDITKAHRLEEFIVGNKPSWIINCAGWTNVEGAEDSPELAMTLNSKSVGNLAFSALKTGSAVIHFSTDYVFDGNSAEPYEVSDSSTPINQYGLSKLRGEQSLMGAGVESAYVVRTSWLFGVQGKNFVKTMARKALSNYPVDVVDDQFGSPTSARDLASATFEIMSEKPSPGIYHFANQGGTSWFEFAQEIYRLSGARIELVKPVKSDEFKTKAMRPKNSVLSTQKWRNSNLGSISNWQDSLRELFPEILAELEKESGL